MTFLTFSKRWTALAAAAFSLLLCASAQGADFKTQEDATKLERPTISSFGRDGIYFIDWDGQNRRLWMKGDFGRIMWSRDGKRVLLSADTDEFGWYTKYIMELETGRVINLSERLHKKGYEHIVIRGAWRFPDGKRLICSAIDTSNADRSDLYALDISSAKLRQVTRTPMHEESWASVSPDGKRIVFERSPPLWEDLEPLGEWVDIDGDGEKEVFQVDGGRFSPMHLYSMNADGSNVVNLTKIAAVERYPEWSPDGKKIAFQASRRPEQEGEILAADVYMMDPDGSNVERLTSRKDGLGGAVEDWSPDGKWILFRLTDPVSMRASLHRIHRETREIVRIGGLGGLPTWVWAGKSRFLSVDPADQKKAQWGKIKAAGGNENSPPPQERNSLGEE